MACWAAADVMPILDQPTPALTRAVEAPLSVATVSAHFAPATAAAVLHLLRSEQVPLTGARAVVVGRSVVVGKPVAPG
jgi:methylenetetrahydrofolate dehydrogenase (NADP+)/methenyltetrahydrofolate cyclohydrolase